ncbi:MAG TPA: hypothetical protein EYP86_02570 [Candidatus Altiarchaeales archaeon]|nr:hypothetical protein [Candidatus Altiarchaeales archaeon]
MNKKKCWLRGVLICLIIGIASFCTAEDLSTCIKDIGIYCHTSTTSSSTSTTSSTTSTSTTTSSTSTTTTVKSGGRGCCGELYPPNTAKVKKTCFNGIRDCHDGLCEEGVDCGGPCRECIITSISTTITTMPTTTTTSIVAASTAVTSMTKEKGIVTCTDGIQNQGEEDIDCGGPCEPCGIEPTSLVDNTVKYRSKNAFMFVSILMAFVIIYAYYRHYRARKQIIPEELNYEQIIDSILIEREFFNNRG